MLTITSPQNPKIKELVAIRTDGNVRREAGCFLIEGRRAVETAMEPATGDPLVELILCPNLLDDDVLARYETWARERAKPVLRVSKDCFRKLADVRTPQGAAALVRIPRHSLRDLLARSDAVVAVACGVQDPGNLGTLVRSAHASGATGLVTLEKSADLYNSKVVRSTAAGLLSLPVARAGTDEFLAEARAAKVRLIGARARDGERFDKLDYSSPLALCVGSEGEGLPEAVQNACAGFVSIPMREGAESLNAGVAGSILLFQAALERL